MVSISAMLRFLQLNCCIGCLKTLVITASATGLQTRATGTSRGIATGAHPSRSGRRKTSRRYCYSFHAHILRSDGDDRLSASGRSRSSSDFPA